MLRTIKLRTKLTDEDLFALSSKEYLRSIRKACRDYKTGRTITHRQVFSKSR